MENQKPQPQSESQSPTTQSGEKSMKITQSTTLKQLIELGLFKASQIDGLNKRLNRQKSKQADSEQQTRANSAVSFYLGKSYGYGRENKFRMKPIEKALLSSGISRRNIEVCVKQLVDSGDLANNKGEVANNCHVRHWRVEPVVESQVEPALDEMTSSEESLSSEV